MDKQCVIFFTANPEFLVTKVKGDLSQRVRDICMNTLYPATCKLHGTFFGGTCALAQADFGSKGT